MMNIAMPSIVIKMMRQKFDQQWSLRKTNASQTEQFRILRFLRDASLALEARLTGPTLTVHDLLGLEEGQLLTFDYPVGRAVDLEVNGGRKFSGHVVSTGKKRAFQIEEMHVSPYPGRTSGDESDGSSGDSG